MLLFALLDDTVEHFAEKLGTFLEDGQSEGGLDVSEVEEPVEKEIEMSADYKIHRYCAK